MFTIDVLPCGLFGSETMAFFCRCRACLDELRRLELILNPRGAQP